VVTDNSSISVSDPVHESHSVLDPSSSGPIIITWMTEASSSVVLQHKITTSWASGCSVFSSSLVTVVGSVSPCKTFVVEDTSVVKVVSCSSGVGSPVSVTVSASLASSSVSAGSGDKTGLDTTSFVVSSDVEPPSSVPSEVTSSGVIGSELHLLLPVFEFLVDLIGDEFLTDIDEFDLLDEGLLIGISLEVSGEVSDIQELSWGVVVFVGSEFTEAWNLGVPVLTSVLKSFTGSFPASFGGLHFVTGLDEGEVVSGEVVVAHVYCDSSKAAHDNNCREYSLDVYHFDSFFVCL